MVAWVLCMPVFHVAVATGMQDEQSLRFGHKADREHMALLLH